MFKKKWKKLAASLLVAAMAVTTLSGCGGKDPVANNGTDTKGGDTSSQAEQGAGEDANKTTSGEGGKTLTYAIGGDPGANVNVITTSDRFGLMTIKMIYSPLCMYNADGINWFLAKDAEPSEDGLTYTFHLRDDVVWSDGEPFTADDVIFTYEAMAKVETSWAYGQFNYDEGSVKIEKVDDYTVSFTMPFVNASSLEMLSNIFIMPKHLYENVTDFENNDINSKPVGTGPYVMTDYQPGSYVKFEKNDKYFLGTPDIDTFIFQIVEKADTAKMALQSGEVNAWIGTPADVAQIKLEESNLTTYPYSEGRVGYMMFNANKVKDENVRKALLFALDKKAMNDACFLSEENYDTPNTFLPNISEFYTDEVEKYEQDIEKSKKMLKEAGAEGLKLKLGYSGSDTVQSTQAVMIQEQLKAVGVTVELASMDATALANQMKDPKNEYDMYLGGYIMGIDPDTFASLFQNGEIYNYMFYDYPKIDELFAEGRKELDMEKRKEIYAKLQAAIQDTGCFYPITSNKRILIMSNKVKNVDAAKLVPVYTFEDTSKLTME